MSVQHASQRQYDSRMTDEMREAIKQALKRRRAFNEANPEAARAALIRMGILTPDGKIAPEYAKEPDSASYRR